MAAGGELIIDNKLLKILGDVDKKLEKIAKTSGSAQANIFKMFDKAGSQGVDGLIRKLQQLEKYYSTIGQNDSRGMKRIANDARKTADEINKLIAAVQQRWTPNFKGAMNYSQSAQNLSQDREAINRLRQARETLSRTDSDYFKKLSQINGAIAVHSSRLRAATGASHEMRKAHSGLMDISGQLTRKLALVFSVSQVQGYINKIVQVRKEFELQQKSLQVLLRDKNEANQLWNQTIQLAVQSPFRVKELVTYTKQLAAYRIETEKLHDTTKMLADVSAGLGVDMNRLILAFGQVRAAEFLRGTELRQFTEAGIPMLEELADHFTELEGRAVSAADVFARISKRMVAFEDVEQVFKKVTSEGGTFYRMQEEQSKTLYGMISNLHDSLDLMMNDIGQSNESVLKGAVELTKTLVDNWRAVASVMEIVGTSLAIKGLTLFVRGFRAASAHALLATTNFRGLALAGAKVNGAMKAIHATLMAHPWYAVAAAVLIATKGLYDYNKSIQQHNKKYDDLSKRELSRIDRLKEIREEVEKNNATIKDNKSKQEELNKAQSANDKILEELKKKFPDLYDGLVQQKNGTIELSNAIEAQNALLQINIALQQASKGGWFQQDLTTNYTQAYDAQSKMIGSLVDIKTAASNARIELQNMLSSGVVSSESASLVDDVLSKLISSTDIKEATDLQREFFKVITQIQQVDKKSVWNIYDSLNEAYQKANVSLANYRERMNDLYDNIDNRIDAYKLGIEQSLAMGGNDAAVKWLDTILESLGIVDEKIKQLAREYITSKVNIKLEFGDDDKEYTEDDLKEDWKKKVWNAIKSVQETNPEIALGVTLKTMVEGDKSSIIPKLQESVKNAIDVTTKDLKGAGLDGQVVFTDEQIVNMEKSIPLLDNLANLIALVRDTKGSGGDKKDWFAEMGKAIRDTHKDFLTLHKDLDRTEALKLALEKHSDVFNEAAKKAGINLNLENLTNYITADSAIDGLEILLEQIPPKAAKSRLAIKKLIGELTGEDKVRAAEEAMQRISNAIESAFSSYEISIELDKMGVTPNFANELFGIDSVDLRVLRQKVVDAFGLIRNGSALSGELPTENIVEYAKQVGLAKEQVELLGEKLRQIDETETKELLQRQQKYLNFLVNKQGERIKLLVQEMRDLEEIKKTFVLSDAKGESFGMTTQQVSAYNAMVSAGEEITDLKITQLGLDAEQTRRLIEHNRLLQAQADIARTGVRRSTQEALDKQSWEEFKTSGYYETMFEDLTVVSNKALDKLEEKVKGMKDALSTLPPAAYKEVKSAIAKIESIKMERNPFSELLKAMKEVRKLNEEGISIKDYTDGSGNAFNYTVHGKKAAQQALEEQQRYQEELNKEIPILTALLTADTERSEYQQKIVDGLDEGHKWLNKSRVELSGIVKNKQEEKRATDKNVEELKGLLALYNKIKQAILKSHDAVGQYAEKIGELFGSTDQLLEALGEGADSSARAWLQSGQAIASMIVQIAQLIPMLFTAQAAMGAIGIAAAAIGAIASVITIFSQLHDSNLQKQIENLEKSVESLTKEYEKLEKAIEDTYSAAELNVYTETAQANLQQQIDGYKKMIELERDKKNTDEEAIADWYDAFEEKEKEMKELEAKRLQELGGLGDEASYKEASESFVDAWLSAFKETGDGMKGLEEAWDEMVHNMVKQQLLTRGVNKIMTKFYDEWDKALEDGAMDEKDWDMLNTLMAEKREQLDEYLQGMAQNMGVEEMAGQGELDTLQKGIQGITEDQADILASYLNSIRFMVGEQVGYLKKIAGVDTATEEVQQNYNPTLTTSKTVDDLQKSMSQQEDNNPMIPHLKTIAEQTSAIHALLDSVTLSGHTKGGQGIKVFID